MVLGVSVPSFPVDWKTVELPLNETFQPYFAAVTSPSLFYLLGPSQGQKTLTDTYAFLRRCTNCENVILIPIEIAVCFCAVDQQKLQEVMVEVATYCTNNQVSLSSTVLSRPAPGAACCAQFSGEKHCHMCRDTWYLHHSARKKNTAHSHTVAHTAIQYSSSLDHKMHC